MMHVVQADVAREELEHLRQLQVGAASQRRLGVAPALGALPVGVLELVLDVEQPDAGRAGEEHGWGLHEQEVAPADQPAERADEHGQGDVRADNAAAHPRARVARDDAGADEERDDRTDAEHHDGVAKQAICQPAASGQPVVLGDGERADISRAATVEVSR